MSSAESTLDDAIPSPTPSSGAKREPLQRRRLDLIYFALAGFDLLTIVLTLMLSNHIMDLYQQSVARSAVWSARVRQVVELAQFAQDANAPGNDVFDSHDVARERARRDVGVTHYRQQRDQVLHALQSIEPGEDTTRVTAHLRSADQQLDEMMREADQIFSEIETGNDETAGRRMATMDRIYGRLSRSLLNAIVALQQIEDANLQRQAQLASNLRGLEFIVMALIFLIVLGVAFYGRRIGQVMRKTEDAHNAMLHELQTANEGLQEYADNVAHELRNPVNKVLLASEVALSRPRSNEEYHETLISIIEESQRLSSIVGSLLFLARARRTRYELERQTIDVAVELGVLRDYYEASAQEASQSIRVSCATGISLKADRVLFQRAIGNLVMNAIAHTPPGGAVCISAEGSENRVVIEVCDTGEGMADDERARVFDRFYRVDKTRNAASGRLGLGLPIVKSIMNLHGGAVALRSQPGRGTVVTLTFPL